MVFVGSEGTAVSWIPPAIKGSCFVLEASCHWLTLPWLVGMRGSFTGMAVRVGLVISRVNSSALGCDWLAVALLTEFDECCTLLVRTLPRSYCCGLRPRS